MVRNSVSPNSGILPTIFRNFMKIIGNSSVSENGPSLYLIANSNWPNVGTKHVSDVMAKMITKIGHFQPRLGFEIGPRQTAVERLSMIFRNFMEIMGNSSVSENGYFRNIIANKDGPNFGTKTGPR